MDQIISRVHVINNLSIRNYKPGDLGYIDFMHCKLYEDEYGLDAASFEQYVMPSMVKFLETKDKQGSMIWVAEYGNQIIGAIAIIRVNHNSAQLRWFLIDPKFRGIGLGKNLTDTAVSFCKSQNYKTVFLWTLDFLEAARYLYEKFGFKITESKSHFLWGKDLTEERWELKL